MAIHRADERRSGGGHYANDACTEPPLAPTQPTLLVHFCFTEFYWRAVVHQSYQTDVNLEHVIRGNSAVIKCSIPSFVADYVSVDSWMVDDDDITARYDHWGNTNPSERVQISRQNSNPLNCRCDARGHRRQQVVVAVVACVLNVLIKSFAPVSGPVQLPGGGQQRARHSGQFGAAQVHHSVVCGRFHPRRFVDRRVRPQRRISSRFRLDR